MTEEIKKQIKDLLTYYPGRGKLALAWLIVIPVLSFVVFYSILGGIFSVSSDDIPQYMFYMAGNSFNWIYKIAVVLMLIRICHSTRTIWRESVTIMASSAGYAVMLGAPCFILAFIWLACHLGTSAAGLMQVVAGLVLALGSLALLIAVLGLIAHRCGLVIPLLLFLTTVYTHFLPIVYPASMVPQHWQFAQTFAVPLAPTITILRQGMLNQELAAGNFWLAALLHAVLGYALAFWMWKRRTQPPLRD